MVKAVSRICPLDLMMKYVQFQVKMRLSHEVPKVTVELGSFSVLSTIEESGNASTSRSHAKHEISALSTASVFS